MSPELLIERENVRQLRESLARRDQRIATLEQEAQLLEQALATAAREQRLLSAALKDMLRRRAGIDVDAPGQLQLLFGADLQPEVTPPHATEAPDGETATDTIKRRHRPKTAARKLAFAKLPQEHVVHAVPAAERVCPVTGLVLVEVGEKLFEELDYQPAKLVVIVHHCKLYGLPPAVAAERRVAPLLAPLPPRALEHSPASARLLAWMLVQKYRHHLPLYRQEEIFAREGLQIPRQTQCDWVLACAARLAPIQAALRRQLLSSGLLQLDDTPVQCQHGRGGRKTQAYLWVLLSPLVEGVVYDFTPGRGYDHVKALLGELHGVLVGDGYAVHGKLADESRGTLVTAGCWSHALRKFRDAIPESPREAAAMVVAIAALFAVEKEADDQEISAAERQVLRQARCPALLADIEDQRRALPGRTSDAGSLGKALTYLTNQWPSLVRFLLDGRVPIHNNECESAIRPVAVGRRNWLFAGSERGGQAAATLYTLIESCRRAGIDPHAYLADVLVRVSSHPASRIDELTPARWKQLFGSPTAS